MIDLSARAEVLPREQRAGGALLIAGDRPELRDGEDKNTVVVVGYASVTDVTYKMADWLGEYDEQVRSGAFAKTLTERDDVRMLLNHDGLPMARTKSETLSLSEILDPRKDPQKRDQTGLWTESSLDLRSGIVKDIVNAVERGDLDQMSFAFQVTRQKWSPDYEQRDIEEVKLFDVSLVTYPANPYTSAGLRASNVDTQARTAYSLGLARRQIARAARRTRSF